MKIRRITVENLTSLEGRHTVDFSRPPLANAGLFAITGPTGSGKTTLLDALCLALYNKTPRLNTRRRGAKLDDAQQQISQSDPRNLLRRGCAYGAAEVAFEGRDGSVYTAIWSVQRARRKSDGNLQQPDLTLYPGDRLPNDSVQAIASGKITETQAAIEQRIGLTFDQFTRAVLLAQGEFAAFLHADDGDRASILQALTGTIRFEDISKAVFETHRAREQTVTQQRLLIQGNPPLPTEEREILENRVLALRTDLSTATAQLAHLQTHDTWWRTLDSLTTARDQAESRKQQTHQECQDAAPRRAKLALIERLQREAMTLQDRVTSTLQTLEKTRIATAETREKYESTKTTSEAACLQLQPLLKREEAARQHLDQTRPRLLQAAQSQSLLAEYQKQLAALDNALQEIHSRLQPLQATLKKTSEEREALRLQFVSLRAEQTRNAHLLPFIENRQSLIQSLSRVQKNRGDIQKARQEVGARSSQKTKLETQSQTFRKNLVQLEAQLENAQQTIANLQTTLEQTESNNPSQTLATRNAEQQDVVGAINILRDVARAQTALATALAESQQLEQRRAERQSALEQLRTISIPAAQTELTLAETTYQRAAAAAGNEAATLRATLAEGHPCPVCGATHHPNSAAPNPHSASSLLNNLKHDVAKARKTLDQLEAQRARAEADIASLSDQLTKAHAEQTDRQKEIAAFQHEQSRLPETLAAFITAPDPLHALTQRHEQNAEEIATLTAAVSRLNQQRSELDSLRASTNQLAKQRDAEKEQSQSLTTNISLLQSELQQLEFRLAELSQDLAPLESVIEPLLAAHADYRENFSTHPQPFIANFETLSNQLHSLADTLAKTEERGREKAASIEALNARITEGKEQQTQLEKSRAQAAANCEKTAHELSKLLGGRSIETVSAESERALEIAIRAVQENREATAKLAESLASAKTELSERIATETNAQRLHAAASTELDAYRNSLDFSGTTCSLEEFSQLLNTDDTWLTNEHARLRQIDEAEAIASASLQEKDAALQQHRQTLADPMPLPDVIAGIAAAQSAQDRIREEAEHLAVQLETDSRTRERNAAITQQIANLEEENVPYAQLNALIGSADGAKFRTIAQRFTLDVLVDYANAHLRQLSSRYRVSRLPGSLNLAVVDEEMGEDRRSATSLSGGETFIVSLALALGLASITARRLRIESLFIDEGFGSLDQETLRTVTDTLMQLESLGRKVGVITHVTEMAEAIPTKIRLIKSRTSSRIEV
jgi:DNA repair protein SbcC/Rad50